MITSMFLSFEYIPIKRNGTWIQMVPKRNSKRNGTESFPGLMLVLPSPPPVHGGSIMCQQLLDSDLLDRVNLTYFDTSHSSPGNEIGSVNLGKIIELLFLIFSYIKKLIEVRPEIVHCSLGQNFSGFFKYSLFILLGKFAGAKTVVRLGGSEFPGFYRQQYNIFKRYIDFTLSRIDKLIVRGETIKAELAQFPLRDIRVLPIGIEAKNKKTNNKPSELSYPIELLFLDSSISKAKGAFVLLKALEKLDELDDFNIYFAGRLIKSEDNLINISSPENMDQKFLDWIDRPIFENRIEYLGFLDWEQKWNWLETADLYVSPSYSEAFPFSVVESMLAMTPVISTPVGGLVDHFEDEEHIFYTPKGEPTALRKRIEYVTQNRPLSIKVAKNARDYVKQQLTIDNYVSRLIRIYEDVINGDEFEQ